MKGWVYIATVSNTEGVVKVGHTHRDPDERVREWGNETGVPGAAKVAYAALVEDPSAIERKVHENLFAYHERGEWFRCDVGTAVAAIRLCGAVLFEDDRVQATVQAARIERENAKKAADEERLVQQQREEGERRYRAALKDWESREHKEPPWLKLLTYAGGALLSLLVAAFVAGFFGGRELGAGSVTVGDSLPGVYVVDQEGRYPRT